MFGPLTGYTIGVTADRRSDEQISLLTGRGARCLHGRTIRTHPLLPEAEIQAPTKEVLAHPPHVVVLNTGIGVRGWLEAADAMLLGEELRAVLEQTTVVTRGPKARGAAVTAGLTVAWNAGTATSTEVVSYLEKLGVAGKRVAVQQDGALSDELLHRVSALGAQVVAIPVYRWSMPDDLAPAEALVRAVCERGVDAITFTARPAVENFVAIASDMGLLDAVEEALRNNVAVFSIGSVCSQAIVEAGWDAPLQPAKFRLGALVMFINNQLAARSTTIELGSHELTLQGRMISAAGREPAFLTDRERHVLDILLERPGVVVSKADLLRRMWGPDATDTHVVEVTVGRLRRRLGEAGVGVETVMRRGYRVSTT